MTNYIPCLHLQGQFPDDKSHAASDNFPLFCHASHTGNSHEEGLPLLAPFHCMEHGKTYLLQYSVWPHQYSAFALAWNHAGYNSLCCGNSSIPEYLMHVPEADDTTLSSAHISSVTFHPP